MPVKSPSHRLELPDGIESKLEEFRRRVWVIKLAEGVLAAAFFLLVSYLLVFALDRLWDTPAWLRGLILVAGSAGLGVWLPLKWHRWVWRTRRLAQVARLLRTRFPRLGDQLLGIVELVQSELELDRSEALCRAAMQQVEAQTRQRDLSDAVPHPRHRRWAWTAAVPSALVLAGLLLIPAAGFNALARWLLPWRDTPRYTFVRLGSLPNKMVVPFAEPFELDAPLAQETSWSPEQGSAWYGTQKPVRARLADGHYRFELPPQKESGKLMVSIGDARKSVAVEPTTRPELSAMVARVKLPDYLLYPDDLTMDVRGGSVSLVKGSRATFEATATRELAFAALNGAPLPIQGDRLLTSAMEVREHTAREFTWSDKLGLSSKEPFLLSITALDDDSPSISCDMLSRENVISEEDVLAFQVLGSDDFGVKSIGMEWLGVEDSLRNPDPARGEKIVSAGGPQQRQVDVTASFCARLEGVEPQTLRIRLFAVDYLPDRERVYSPYYTLHVLTPQEHAIWLTEQLRKWFRAAHEVYEFEQRLHEANKELRSLPAGELDQADTRRRIEAQAAAERTNARRLDDLSAAGERLIKKAAQNDQFNVQTLDTWAKMLLALRDIAKNRMPSVADLLKQAADAPAVAARGDQTPGQASDPKAQESPPQVGVNRDARAGKAADPKPGETPRLPSISDIESGFNELDQKPKQEEQQDAQSGGGKFGLPVTVIQGGGPKPDDQGQACPAQQKVDQAVQEQEDLLAEFAKVAEELQKILENLEGSTFVKRLKAASRRQLEVAGDLRDQLLGSFGVDAAEVDPRSRSLMEKVAEREVAEGDVVYVIQEDLEAYYNRVHEGKFKTVLSEMRDLEVVGGLQDIAEQLGSNLNGRSIAQAEFWSDALDRWAEQLVGPG